MVLKGKLQAWKKALELRGLRIDFKDTKKIIKVREVKHLAMMVSFFCRNVLDTNSIFSQFHKCWFHKRSSGTTCILQQDDEFNSKTLTSQEVD